MLMLRELLVAAKQRSHTDCELTFEQSVESLRVSRCDRVSHRYQEKVLLDTCTIHRLYILKCILYIYPKISPATDSRLQEFFYFG